MQIEVVDTGKKKRIIITALIAVAVLALVGFLYTAG